MRRSVTFQPRIRRCFLAFGFRETFGLGGQRRSVVLVTHKLMVPRLVIRLFFQFHLERLFYKPDGLLTRHNLRSFDIGDLTVKLVQFSPRILCACSIESSTAGRAEPLSISRIPINLSVAHKYCLSPADHSREIVGKSRREWQKEQWAAVLSAINLATSTR